MLSKKYLIKQLKNIKIKEKYIIIHSDVTGIIFKNFSLKLLWEIIFECLGKDKTYIFPTFTFAIKNKTWDYNLVYSNWFHKTWSIIPKYNLVENQDIYDKINTHKNGTKIITISKMAVYKKNHFKSIKTRKIVNGIIFNELGIFS
jgi:aminoglycoside N3'-acetyltransferase